jgi:ADP-heptose:LPS heptosyltransferase
MVYRTDDESLKKLGTDFVNLFKSALVPDDGNGHVTIDSDTLRQKTSVSKGKRKLILQCPHSPGDITMLTAAIRDLHNTYPGEYQTDVESPCNEIFEGNPFITHLDRNDPDVAVCRTHYPIIHDSNEGSYHFIHGYRKHLEEIIGRPIKQGHMKTDLYIRDEEKGWVSAVQEATGDDRPFWIIDAGYKNDFTAKAWSFKRYQQVVDHFKDKIQFAQIGHKSHNHPDLKGVINLLGQTDSRQLIRLVYHSVGILTPVSWPMVLAAGVPMKKSPPKNRACVVLSGGREPVQWQMYPNHQFLHTCGTMMCCDNGGCWKSRVVPLGDGDDKDKNNLCLNPVKVDGQNIAMCMARITVADVVRAIERYYEKPMATIKYDLWVGRKTVHIDYENRDKVRMNTYDDDLKKNDVMKVVPHNEALNVSANLDACLPNSKILDMAKEKGTQTITAEAVVADIVKG